MLLCDGFQESLRYQESRCLFQFRARMCQGLNKSCHAERTNLCPSSMSFQTCQLMGHWFSNPVHISITVTASTKQRSHMQVSSSDHCERTILSTGSIFAKGQINEECVLHNVASWQSLSLADTSDLVSRRFFGCWCRLLTAFRNPCITRNHVACSSSEQECAKDWTNLAMLEEQTLALIQCLSSLANWWGVRAAMQFISITSAEERADMQVSASDRCERTNLFTALCFNLAKDQINEGEKAWVWQKPQTLCWDEP